MPERHEHSYYEISLSGTQMVVAFVLVLGCLLAAFFAGVYVGRDGSVTGMTADAGPTGPEPSPAAAEEEDEGRLGEFDFFSDEEPEEAPPAPREIARQADPQTTLLEDVGGQEPEEEAAPAPREETQAERREPEATPAPEQQAPAPSEPPEDVDAQPAEAGGLVIQVFSTDNYEQAQQVLEQLRGGGLPAFLSPVEVSDRTMHRVRVGPYSERARAEQIAQRVRETYQLDTWITRGE